MRPIIYLACVLTVMGLAFWAYRENYRTQAALSDMSNIQREMGNLRDELGILRAEWAYLNRPERLRELVALNYEKLQLGPVESDQLIDLGNIDYAKPPEASENEDGDAPEEGQP